MVRAALAFTAVASFGSAIGRTLVDDKRDVYERSLLLNEPCQKIASSISDASDVYDAASVNYLEDISHWGVSSTQLAACSFEPGTPEDVGIALRILGETQTPFAVKGGGHTANPGFSSTTGVQIAMSRFCDVDYNPATQTVTFGAGLVWDDVYAALEQYEVNVVGGRVTGVGVAGFTLGGGYSWLTNQYGLTIDTVQAYELVMPNGTTIDVTETSSPDLFFALKGGLNNFGIVTRFTLKTFSQGQIWGGVIFYPPTSLDEITKATANFVACNKDPKAAMITSYNYIAGVPEPTVIVFYDAPEMPDEIFDEFLAIPALNQGIDVSTRSYFDFVKCIPVPPPRRIIFDSFSTTDYSLPFLERIVEEADSMAINTLLNTATFINYDVEPFLPTLYTHNKTPSAYPPDRTRGFMPFEIYFAWELPVFDQVVQDAIRGTKETLQKYAIANGQSDADLAVYPNYAIFDTPLDKMYGANLPRLREIKKAVDPENVMGLAGGFRF
ncbi:FAD dependent oxidoreductase [Boletus edulis]|nr:FAD dependent oxidoreductase [Boletus edulis]